MLDGQVSLKGVHAPVHPEVCEPSLAELDRLAIRFRHKEEARVRADMRR